MSEALVLKAKPYDATQSKPHPLEKLPPPPVRCKFCPTWLRGGNTTGVCAGCSQKRLSREQMKETQMVLEPDVIPLKKKQTATLNLAHCRELTPKPDRLGEKVARLREAVLDSITPEDVDELMKTQLAKAKAGDSKAVKLVLDLIGNNSAGSKQQVMIVQQNAGNVPQKEEIDE